MWKRLALASLALAVASGCSPAPAPASPPAASGSGGAWQEVPTPSFHTDPKSEPTAPAAPSCSGLDAQPLDSTWNVQFRAVLVHVPAAYDPAAPMPVVLNFHGYTSDATEEEALSDMNAKADVAGFIAVYPNGTGTPQSWNAGACCGQAAQDQVDDVGFVRALLDNLESKLCVDEHRIFATGMSNGGFLSHRLACELSDRIAAFAPVAGVLGVTDCAPQRPVPIMGFHGTADPLVPYGGSPQLGFPPVVDTYAGWAKRDGCSSQTMQTFDNMDAHCATYLGCAQGSEVTLCTVDNGGHSWPGGLPVPALGYTTPNLSATDAMWTFFQKHPLP